MAETYPNRFYLHAGADRPIAQRRGTDNFDASHDLGPARRRRAEPAATTSPTCRSPRCGARSTCGSANRSTASSPACAAGRLPNVSYVDPRFLDEGVGHLGRRSSALRHPRRAAISFTRSTRGDHRSAVVADDARHHIRRMGRLLRPRAAAGRARQEPERATAWISRSLHRRVAAGAAPLCSPQRVRPHVDPEADRMAIRPRAADRERRGSAKPRRGARLRPAPNLAAPDWHVPPATPLPCVDGNPGDYEGWKALVNRRSQRDGASRDEKRAWSPLRRASRSLSALAAAGATGPATAGAATATWRRPPVRHVFVVNLENEGYDTDVRPGLAGEVSQPHAARRRASSSTSTTAPRTTASRTTSRRSAARDPNPQTQGDCQIYTDFTRVSTTGEGQAVGSGCVYPASVPTLANQLASRNLTWKGYMQDIANSPTEAKSCRHPAIGTRDDTQVARVGDQYATRHNPFVYFHAIIDSPSCAAPRRGSISSRAISVGGDDAEPRLHHAEPLQRRPRWPCVDGRPGGLVSADAWLRTWIPKILASPAFVRDGMLVVTFDEAELEGSEADASACCGEGPRTELAAARHHGPRRRPRRRDRRLAAGPAPGGSTPPRTTTTGYSVASRISSHWSTSDMQRTRASTALERTCSTRAEQSTGPDPQFTGRVVIARPVREECRQ